MRHDGGASHPLDRLAAEIAERLAPADEAVIRAEAQQHEVEAAPAPRKKALAAAAIALKAAKRLGVEPRRNILFQSVVGEETGGLGTLAAIERGYRADAAVITEPTGLELCPVQAGALSFRLHVRGKAAHGAMRASGVSAVEKFGMERGRLVAYDDHETPTRGRELGVLEQLLGNIGAMPPMEEEERGGRPNRR